MMNFIKKNIALTIVIVVTVLIAGGLTYLFLGEIEQYDIAKESLNKALDTSETLRRARISPKEENLLAVKEDEAHLKKLLNDVHDYFGHPYKKAEEKFKKELEDSIEGFDYDQFVEAVKLAWSEDPSKISYGSKFLSINEKFTKDNNGFDPIPKEVLEKAIKAFELQYDRLSLGVKMKDYKSLSSKIPFYLDTIGVDRTMLQTASRRYMNDQQAIILDYLNLSA